MEDGLNQEPAASPTRSDGSPGDVLAEVQAHFTRAIQALNALIDRIEGGELPGQRETSLMVTDARRAMQVIFDERKKVEDQLRKDAGTGYGQAVDFEAAHAEIRSRLDRLRTARSSG